MRLTLVHFSERLNHLVFPLSSKFVIDPTAELPIRQRRYSQKSQPLDTHVENARVLPALSTESPPPLIRSSLGLESLAQSDDQVNLPGHSMPRKYEQLIYLCSLPI